MKKPVSSKFISGNTMSNRAARRIKFRQRGFALVVTLSLMILLTIIAVGLLSLSVISLRVTGAGADQAIAKNNARLAMMLALADLQKYAGPDQRVTAHSSLLKSSESESIPNDAWVGVWRTDGFSKDNRGTKMIRMSGGGYMDGRTGTPFVPGNQALGWIVSGKDSNPSVALSDADSVVIRKGPLPVRVPLVNVYSRGSGRMAYWASDESTKAKLNLKNPYADKQPDLADASAGGYNRLVSPLASDASVFFTSATELKTDEPAKVVSSHQLEISSLAKAAGLSSAKETVRESADDFTVYSKSVLADPVAGGMKADLTAYFEDGPVAASGSLKGLADADGIISTDLPNRRMAGPKFGILRNWYKLRDKITGTMKDRMIEEQLPATTATTFGSITDPGTAFVKPIIEPVMTEAVYYLRHVINTSTVPARMVELIYPRVVLWNPFNTKLKTAGHIVHFDFRLSHNVKVLWTNPQTGKNEEQNFNLNLNFDYNLPQHLAFYIPPTEFDPGEALCFTCGGNSRVTPYDASTDLRVNALSATANPSDLNCYSREWPGNSQLLATFDFPSARIRYDSNSSIIWNGSNRTQGVLLHSLLGIRSTPTVASLLAGGGPPVVRQIALDNYSRGNNGRWLVGYNPARLYKLSEVIAGGVQPDSLLTFGGRFRYLYETYANRVQGQSNNEPWYYAPLIHHNIGAPNIHRWPMDNIFGLAYINVSATGISNGSGNGPHIYAYGPIAQARQWSEWTDPEVLAHRASNGKYRTSVFTDASFSTNHSTYPVYTLPSKEVPLVSLGALQNVQISPFAWHPTQTIGQSFPAPFIPSRPAVTSRAATEEAALWKDKVRYLIDGNYDITGFDKIFRASQDILFNDICFEVNQSLWDRYFLSAIPRGGAGAAWNGTQWNLTMPLPNPRLHIDISLSNNGSKAELTSFHRAARSLWLDGGFNVNTTSIKAWESLLRSFRNIKVPTRSGSSTNTDGTAYAGMLVAEEGGVSSVMPKDSRFWNAYRLLTDDEITLLATEIVNQTHQRGPYLGVADFVNRRLVATTDSKRGKHAFGGAIQSAISTLKELNDVRQDGWLMPSAREAAAFQYGADYWGGPISKPESQNYELYQTGGVSRTAAQGTGAAAHLNQGDILQQIGSVLVARGDTFVIRGYGEALDATGNVTARAWCEAVVQRTPVPIDPDPTVGDLNPKSPGSEHDFGRRFQIESFRWLAQSEV